MSTTDDFASTSTPDATTLDPAMLDEVEQALDAAQFGGEQTDGGIPQAETTKPGGIAQLDDITGTGGVAQPLGGIPQPETPTPLTGGIPQPEGPNRGGVAHPNGGIPQAETVHP